MIIRRLQTEDGWEILPTHDNEHKKMKIEINRLIKEFDANQPSVFGSSNDNAEISTENNPNLSDSEIIEKLKKAFSQLRRNIGRIKNRDYKVWLYSSGENATNIRLVVQKIDNLIDTDYTSTNYPEKLERLFEEHQKTLQA